MRSTTVLSRTTLNPPNPLQPLQHAVPANVHRRGSLSTFILAGHKTTASALTWCLYALPRDRNAQDRLRQELRGLTSARNRKRRSGGPIYIGDGASVGPASGSRSVLGQEQTQAQAQGDGDGEDDDNEDSEMLLDRLSGCEYLDWVVREASRSMLL